MAFARSGALRSGGQRFAAAVRIILIMLFAGEWIGIIYNIFLISLTAFV